MIINRATRDTIEGQGKALFVLVVGGVLGLGYLYLTKGTDVAVAEVPYFFAAVVGAVIALALLFLWNLACAPFRIERERRLTAEAELVDLREQVASKPRQRTLSFVTRTRLAEVFARLPPTFDEVNVAYTALSSEAADFAAEISEVIERAGRKSAAFHPPLMDEDPRDRGILLYHSADEVGREAAELIRSAFAGSEFILGLREFSETNKTYAMLYIARAPEQ